MRQAKSHYNPRTNAVVRITTTGQALATIAPPRPYGTFVGVTAAADDRTFVLAAQKARIDRAGHLGPATRFFLLRLGPAAAVPERSGLTPLPIPAIPAGTGLVRLRPVPGRHPLALVCGPGSPS